MPHWAQSKGYCVQTEQESVFAVAPTGDGEEVEHRAGHGPRWTPELGHHCSHPLGSEGASSVCQSKIYPCTLLSFIVPGLGMMKVEQNVRV